MRYGDETECLPTDHELHFVPMVQGAPGTGNHPDWEEPVAADWFYHILGFNEPNQPDQSNLSPKDAAYAWMDLQALYPNKTLVSPAMGHADTEWFDSFWAKCQELGCRIDQLAVHMYNGEADLIMDTLEAYSKRYGNKKIWLSEFAVKNNHNEDEIIAFIEEILPRLEAAPFIFRYSWFITRYYPNPDMTGWFWLDPVNSLLQQNSSDLTAVGRAYDFPYHMYL